MGRSLLVVDDSKSRGSVIRKALQISGLEEAKFFEGEHGEEALLLCQLLLESERGTGFWGGGQGQVALSCCRDHSQAAIIESTRGGSEDA